MRESITSALTGAGAEADAAGPDALLDVEDARVGGPPGGPICQMKFIRYVPFQRCSILRSQDVISS